jgi:hypothetical protein
MSQFESIIIQSRLENANIYFIPKVPTCYIHIIYYTLLDKYKYSYVNKYVYMYDSRYYYIYKYMYLYIQYIII